MKLRLLFLFFTLTLVVPAVATAATTTTQTAPKPYCVIHANPGSVEIGQTVNLTWTSEYATGGTITSLGSVGPSGVQGVIPTRYTNTYVGAFTGPGGVANCYVTVGILQGDAGSAGGNFTNGGTSGGTALPTPTTQVSSGNGLIPCGNTTGLTPGTDAYAQAASSCQLCHLAGLAQNIINWLVGISIPLAAAMFAYAGVIYFTSGAVGKIADAHKIFKNVGIGFLIVISAWLGIQTILQTVLAPGFYQSWNTIQCVDSSQRPLNKTVQDVLNLLPGLRTDVSATTPTSGYNVAPTSFVLDQSGNIVPMGGQVGQAGGFTLDQSGNIVPISTLGTGQWDAQLATACANSGLSDCAVAQAILARESSGNAGSISDKGAGGLMQLMPATACGIDSSINGCSTGDYNAVRQALTSDPQLNMNLGTQELARLYNKYNGDLPSIAAAYNGGDKANVCGSDCQSARDSGVCPGVTAAYQCTAFPGYAETRKYVPNVVATYNSLKR